MAKINVLVVEDESIVSKDIQQSLTKLGYKIIGAAASGEKAIEIIQTETPDVILMDIMLKGELNGIETARRIKKKHNVPVIYLTAYADEDTLSKAKVTEPHGYILKPFKEIDLHTTIEMAIYKHEQEKTIKKERDLYYSLVENSDKDGFIFVKANSKLVKINNNEIFFVEALKDYVTINLKAKRYTIHSTMKDIESKLHPKEFARVHRSFIVRLDKIKSIEQNNIILEEEKKILPIGGSYKEELGKKINLI